MAYYVTADPAILGRLDMFLAILAGVIIVDVVIVLAVTRDRRTHRAREAAINARLARRYGKTQAPMADVARRLQDDR